MTQAQATMRRIGLELIEEKRRATEGESEKAMKNDVSETRGKRVQGRDLLSILSAFYYYLDLRL